MLSPQSGPIHAVSSTEATNQGQDVIILDEFLSQGDFKSLTEFIEQSESQFSLSNVNAADGREAGPNPECRLSRVLYELGPYHSLISERLHIILPTVLERMGRAPFKVSEIEVQLTASNDGDYFKRHQDNDFLSSRKISYVCFIHKEPKAFVGGELKIYGLPGQEDRHFYCINPQHNQIVFFPSHLIHEIAPVSVSSREFMDSRFTVNGWIHKKVSQDGPLPSADGW
jgi:SM-20-related protein